MDTLSALLGLCREDLPITGGFSTQTDSNVGLFAAILDKLSLEQAAEWILCSRDITLM